MKKLALREVMYLIKSHWQSLTELESSIPRLISLSLSDYMALLYFLLFMYVLPTLYHSSILIFTDLPFLYAFCLHQISQHFLLHSLVCSQIVSCVFC